ncbi:MAG: phosphoribosylformylglycinamidine synthase II [Bacteroidia bacterium]|jgi:phosphoribosylformylglycinamidine synthase
MSPATTAPDAWRVEVFKRAAIHDPEGDKALHEVHELGLRAVQSIRVGHGYLLSPSLSEAEAQTIADELLCNPVLEVSALTAPGSLPGPAPAGSRRVLVAPKPGVMDPIAESVKRIIQRTGRGDENLETQTFRIFEMKGEVPTDELESICRRTLANVTIDTLRIDREDLPFGVPKGHGEGRGRVEVNLLGLDDASLEELSVKGELSLTLLEMQEIQKFYKSEGREPSACELETLAQTWSEHCKHKTFAGLIDFVDHSKEGSPTERIDNLLKSTIKRATEELDVPWCVSVFHDNAGIIEFDAGYDISFKVETHNHPSAIDPYGGAGTGIGGVIRDILGVGLGARPIANTNAFFVGMPDMPMEDLPKGCMHPRRILRGVVGGVRDYGNRMGIPTVSGGLWFDDRYVGNPLVYAGTVGLAKREFAHKTIEPGDLVVTLGGAVGRDGIHGATFSSIELTEDSEEDSASSVQIGNPIEEKRVLDAMLQARDRGLFRAVTDCGAGGLSSAVGEMGEEGGVDVDLSKVPLKYPGLASHEIWISEAQERMVLAVPEEKLQELLDLCATEDVAATVIGTFNDTKRLVVRDAGEIICDIEMGFLHDGTPRYLRHAVWNPPTAADPGCPAPKDHGATYNSALLGIMAAPDVRSKEWIIRQYDHEVQGNTVIKPLVGVHSDAPGNGSVIKPLPQSKKGVAIGCGANPRMGLLDPYAMAGAVIDEALRNVVAVGGDPEHTAILDNFSWGNCAKPENLGSLVLASKACYDAAMAFGTPFISGKDSLNNEFRVGNETIVIPPTLLLSAMSVVPDVANCVTMDAKSPGNRIYLVGDTKQEMGASHYFHHLGLDGGRVPTPDLKKAPLVMKTMHAAIAAGQVSSCHDLSEGGLAAAAAEMAFGGGLGMDLHLSHLHDPEGWTDAHDEDAVLLFSESCTRFLVEVTANHAEAFERRFTDAGLGDIARPIGEVTAGTRLTIRGKTAPDCIELDIEELRSAHKGGFAG